MESVEIYQTHVGTASYEILKTKRLGNGIKELAETITGTTVRDNMTEILANILLGSLVICVLYKMYQSLCGVFHPTKPEEVIIVHSHFNIKNAVMCVNCETVFSRKSYKNCPDCTSDQTYIVGLALKTNEVCEHIKMKGVTLQ